MPDVALTSYATDAYAAAGYAGVTSSPSSPPCRSPWNSPASPRQPRPRTGFDGALAARRERAARAVAPVLSAAATAHRRYPHARAAAPGARPGSSAGCGSARAAGIRRREAPIDGARLHCDRHRPRTAARQLRGCCAAALDHDLKPALDAVVARPCCCCGDAGRRGATSGCRVSRSASDARWRVARPEMNNVPTPSGNTSIHRPSAVRRSLTCGDAMHGSESIG